MNWNQLTTVEQLQSIKEESFNQPVLIFKHSTRCSISSTALSRVERNWKQEAVGELKPYYLDLIANRPVSNAIVEEFGVEHQSPQVILIKDGASVYDASHFDIRFEEIAETV
ncbi:MULTISPECIES: bacillithiol system redox-active protein YtxJ [Flectobacillus]|uniref:bacillithiol system redox-active protein YtxJ n=1 Tax=Flectobacillus TaxID=101 RepID=UPI000BA3A93A|nr:MULTISPECIES: bacillithiol system redox-active protein YtxJ [Flectobacillus]MDI9869327.1 bacillithiol system redox-active protein YtxJ [Flectobacillus roseus]PAC32395.1 thioredoxin family protein [Flectobacillus sp. BAB-3569]